ncbi:MAG TPA: OmpH family outer membrane protein [Thermoanaerobaculia bacterium]
MRSTIHRLSRASLGTALIVLGALGMALAVPTLAAAQAPAQGVIKIAVIDTEKILLNSQAGKRALAELKKVQEQKEKEGLAKQQEIKDLQAKIADGRLSLAQDKLEEMQKQLEDKVIALRRFQDDATRDLNKKRDDVLGAIDQQVMPVINQAGKELGYTLIFRKFESGLIYADEAVDITSSIIQRLDAGAGAAQQGKGGK